MFGAVKSGHKISDAWSKSRVIITLLLPTLGHHRFACEYPGSCFKITMMKNIIVCMSSGYAVHTGTVVRINESDRHFIQFWNRFTALIFTVFVSERKQDLVWIV